MGGPVSAFTATSRTWGRTWETLLELAIPGHFRLKVCLLPVPYILFSVRSLSWLVQQAVAGVAVFSEKQKRPHPFPSTGGKGRPTPRKEFAYRVRTEVRSERFQKMRGEQGLSCSHVERALQVIFKDRERTPVQSKH